MRPQTHPASAAIEWEESLRGVLALGVLEADGLGARGLAAEFEAEARATCERLLGLYAGKSPADIPGVAETRSMFHRLDIDPTKTRPSSEALLRRVLQGKGLPRVSPAVDVCNLCSLEHQLPLGLYDRDAIRGGVRMRVGREGEGYPGIRKQRVNLSGRLLLSDDEGPFGAPTSDSLRTSVGPGTRALLVVVFCPRERAGGDVSTALEKIADLLTRYCGAGVVAVRVQN
jgi:DNA/RNA-binding domain of Phe-tRNA-synthetase-like protein